jgi:hypothetical protein
MDVENSNSVKQEEIERAVVDLAVESWRFQKLFSRALAKLDAGESLRFANQHRYFIDRIERCLASAGFKLVNVEGHAYDPGAAVTPLNIGDFDPDDELVIDQMIEPVVMSKSGLLRAGTVMLRKAKP